jgi:hypothetical protein
MLKKSGHTFSTSYPVRPATRPALRAGQVVGPAGSHQNIQRRNRSVFYPSIHGGLSANCFLATAGHKHP